MQLDYLLRLFIAGVCGLAIGYERKNRMKEAGIRTHFIVSIGAALIMIISKYGFQDQMGWSNTTLDPSRIAAQVVTGVGFLGAGIIFMKEESITGLTTAAGIWATAGIGLAVGSGLYSVGLEATILIILGQILLHSKIRWLTSAKTELLILQVIDEPETLEKIHEILEEQDITVIKFKSKSSNEPIRLINLEILISVNESFDVVKLGYILQKNSFVKSVRI